MKDLDLIGETQVEINKKGRKMVGNKRIKTDELQGYYPHGHPQPCPRDLRQPEGVNRCQKFFIMRGRGDVREKQRKVTSKVFMLLGILGTGPRMTEVEGLGSHW
ncbi:hypothetical protein IM40_00415 [Candidatus Paracaedimonas acanthamoebae]|nr:hypothetical protein IM40_00415 [Candidatus Paracaedimonas acanthamoebae]